MKRKKPSVTTVNTMTPPLSPEKENHAGKKINSPVPKYIRVRDKILADIRNDVLKPGDRLPTRKELTITYNVSRTTLDKALSSLLESNVLSASRRGGTFVSKNKIPINAVIVSRLDRDKITFWKELPELGEMFSEIIMNTQDEINLTFLDIIYALKKFHTLSEYDAIVWIQPDDSIFERLRQLKNKVIVTNRYPENINFVSTNHRQAIRTITEYYLRGHSAEDSQVYYLDYDHEYFVTSERREGFIEACSEFQRFYRICQLNGDFGNIYETLMKLDLPAGKKIIMIAASGIFTGAVLKMIAEKKLIFGDNFFYSDFDNANSLENTGIKVPTIIQDYKTMGIEVVNAIRNISCSEIRTFVPFRIVLP